MKLIINASNLSGTGVVQVAVSFISECTTISEHEYYIFISRRVASQLKFELFPSNFHFFLIKSHPFYGLHGIMTRRLLRKLEKRINPDVVFTVFGPSYWNPMNKHKHLIGYAYPHYVYPDSPLFKLISCRERLYREILKKIHKYFFLRNGSFYVCETDDVKKRLTAYLPVRSDCIFTVNNTCNHYFFDFVPSDKRMLPQKVSDEFRFLSLCSPYIHKNLIVLNSLVPILRKRYPLLNLKFVLTIDNLSFDRMFDSLHVRDYLINIGPINIADCPQLYSECDAVFLPTLLECFTANYPEAMFMGKPILTSNLSFATSICKDAALYFNPMDVEDILNKIVAVVRDRSLYDSLVFKGREHFKNFSSPKKRALQYLSICERIMLQ